MVEASPFPPEVRYELEGWELAWFRLLPSGRGAEALARLRVESARGLAGASEDATEVPVVGAVRRLFRAAGCDPTRYRPSSEALARRLRKQGELTAISPLVDLNNLLSLRLMVPCCVIDAISVRPPFTLRVGRSGEEMVSLRGPFNLEGRPVLVDALGPFGTPITDSERVKVTDSTREVWLVAYLVAGMGQRAAAEAILGELLAAAPVAEVSA